MSSAEAGKPLPPPEGSIDAQMERVYSDRICPAEDTLRRVAPCLAAFGITRVSRLTGLDQIGVPVWAAVRPNARALSVCQGKGISDADARASATMEALERAVAEQPSIAQEWAAADELASSRTVFDPVEELLAAGTPAFDRRHAISWVKATSLIDGGEVLVPFEAVELDRTKACRYWQSSDGLASGNTVGEAVFHGLLERIERDADTLWKINPPARRREDCFDPADLHDAVLNMLVGRVRDAGLRLTVFDMTSENGIPAVSALVGPLPTRNAAASLPFATGGSGAHPDAARATIRAVTEAIQSRLTLISGARDDLVASLYDNALPQAVAEDLSAAARLAPPADVFRDRHGIGTQTAAIIESLRASGLSRIHAVHLNPSEDRFAVVKVLVPELENPQGGRRQRFGRRALSRLVRFR